MNYEILSEIATAKACDVRNVCTLLKRPDFEKLYAVSTAKEQDQVVKLVEAGAHEALRAWYRARLSKELGDKNVRDLRQIASALGIPDYTRLTKSHLLSEIVKRKHEPRDVVPTDKVAP